MVAIWIAIFVVFLLEKAPLSVWLVATACVILNGKINLHDRNKHTFHESEEKQ